MICCVGWPCPPTVTVQQLQQIVKSVAGGGQGQPTQQIISHAVLAKPGAPGQTVQARVLPVSGVAARQGQQTIQVVAAPQGTVRGSSPSVSLDQLGRPQANALASALAAGTHGCITTADNLTSVGCTRLPRTKCLSGRPSS